MPDAQTMCRDTGCPIRHRCRRYRRTPAVRQAYFHVSPWGLDEPNVCHQYASVGDGNARDLRPTEDADHDNRLAMGATR